MEASAMILPYYHIHSLDHYASGKQGELSRHLKEPASVSESVTSEA
jgi:hypothetical protein